MKKRTMLLVGSICLTAVLVLAGCSNKNNTPPSGGQETPSTPPASTPEAPSETTPDAGVEGEVSQLVALLGKSDGELVEALGEGTGSSDDGGTVQAREYSQSVYGVGSNLVFAYEGETISKVAIYAEENQFASWEEQLTAEFGQADGGSDDATEGGDSREKTWTLEGGALLSLKDAYGALSLEIFQAA